MGALETCAFPHLSVCLGSGLGIQCCPLPESVLFCFKLILQEGEGR